MRTSWSSEREPELNKALADWVSVHLFGEMNGFGPCSTMGVFEDGKIKACMVFHNFDRRHGVIEISGASTTPEWLKRHVLREMFAYPFEQLGCQLIVMRVSAKDTRLPRILTAYGFERFYIPRLRGRDEGECIFTLTEETWRTNGFNRKGIPLSRPANEAVAA